MLIRNTANTNSDQSVTIATPGQFPGTTYYAREFAELNNKYFICQWDFRADSAVVIKAKINSNAEGYFFGGRNGSNANFSIRKQGNKIYWKMGSDEYNVNFPTDDEPHLYGFSNGRPWMDGAYVNNTAHTGDFYYPFIFGGCFNFADGTTDCIYSTSGYAIRVYEVAIHAKKQASLPYSSIGHFYAASDGEAGTTAYLYETRETKTLYSTNNGKTVTSVNPLASLGTTVRYGITIEDLRYAFGSGYHDLMGLYCSMGGSEKDWTDKADIITDNNGVQHKFAFCMKDVPLPPGFTYTRGDNPDRGYAKGDLIFGLTPNWHIWADGLHLGRYVVVQGRGSGTEERRRFRYNIFRVPYITQETTKDINLMDFIGYNNSGRVSRPPHFNLTSEALTFEFHNGVMNFCSAGNGETDLGSMVPLYTSDTDRYGDPISKRYVGAIFDDKSMFFASKDNIGKAKMALGNLVNWELSLADLTRADGRYQDETFTGMAVSILYAHEGYSAVARAWLQTTQTATDGKLMPFCTETDAATKALFRDGLENGQEKEFDVVYAANDESTPTQHDWNKILYEDFTASPDRTLETKARIDAIIKRDPLPSAPYDHEVTSTEQLLSTQPVILKGNLDTKIGEDSGITNYRTILNTKSIKVGGTERYIFPLNCSNGNQGQSRDTRAKKSEDSIPSPTEQGGFKFYFSLLSSAADVLRDYYDDVLVSGKKGDGTSWNIPVTVKFTKANANGTSASYTCPVKNAVLYQQSGISRNARYTIDRVSTTVFPNGKEELDNGLRGTDWTKVQEYVFVLEFRFLDADNGMATFFFGENVPPGDTIPNNVTAEITIGDAI